MTDHRDTASTAHGGADDNPRFAPSDVRLVGIPLVNTFGSLEAEAFATLMVVASVFHGDRWQGLTPKMIGEALSDALENKRAPLYSLRSNPFWRPDPWRLIEQGYAALGGSERTVFRRRPVEFTPLGFRALRRWVRAR